MSKFEDHVKSTAFNLQLSSSMVRVLLSMSDGDADEVMNIHPYKALKRRGLIALNINGIKGPSLTKEGELVCELLKMARYK